MSETWVDVPAFEIAPANIWPTLTINQLFEVKSQLQDKLFMGRGNAGYERPLKTALAQLESIISWKLSDAQA